MLPAEISRTSSRNLLQHERREFYSRWHHRSRAHYEQTRSVPAGCCVAIPMYICMKSNGHALYAWPAIRKILVNNNVYRSRGYIRSVAPAPPLLYTRARIVSYILIRIANITFGSIARYRGAAPNKVIYPRKSSIYVHMYKFAGMRWQVEGKKKK